MDAVTAIRTLERKHVFDIVFMDPPYNKGLDLEALEALKDSSIIDEDTTIIIEAPLDADITAYEMDAYRVTRQKKYKTNQHIFMHRI